MAIMAQVAVEHFVEIAMPSRAVESHWLPPRGAWVEIVAYQVFVVDPYGETSSLRVSRLRWNTGQGGIVYFSVLLSSATLFTPEQPTTNPFL